LVFWLFGVFTDFWIVEKRRVKLPRQKEITFSLKQKDDLLFNMYKGEMQIENDLIVQCFEYIKNQALQ
jgi:hypothetical protein